jgi:hypothetical protein
MHYENSKQIYPEKEVRGLSTNFHIHVSVSDLNISTIGLPSAAGKYEDRSWKYINRSETHECGNWDWGRAIPFLGIHKWDFRCSLHKSSEYLPNLCKQFQSRTFIQNLSKQVYFAYYHIEPHQIQLSNWQDFPFEIVFNRPTVAWKRQAGFQQRKKIMSFGKLKKKQPSYSWWKLRHSTFYLFYASKLKANKPQWDRCIACSTDQKRFRELLRAISIRPHAWL